MNTKYILHDIEITYSNGRCRNGQQYAFIRPSQKCFNRSRRCRVDKIDSAIKKHFPVVNYYRIDGHVIGAKDERSALGEYWRVCELDKIGMDFPVELITAEASA